MRTGRTRSAMFSRMMVRMVIPIRISAAWPIATPGYSNASPAAEPSAIISICCIGLRFCCPRLPSRRMTSIRIRNTITHLSAISR